MERGEQCLTRAFEKCLDWSTSRTEPNLVAIGQTTGRVLLMNMGGDRSSDRIKSVFAPKQPRQCNVVAWNPVFHGQLAAGFDRTRSDHYSCMVWDLNELEDKHELSLPSQSFESESANCFSLPTGSLDERYGNSPSAVAEYAVHPKVRLANLEETSCLAWLPNMPHCLMLSTKNRWIRIYDTRQGTSAVSSVSIAPTRAVRGIRFSPVHPCYAATFSGEPGIKLWDIRSFREPVLQISTASRPVEVAWCPVRGDLLGGLLKEETCIRVYNVSGCESSQQDAAAPLAARSKTSSAAYGALKDAKGDDGPGATPFYQYVSNAYEVLDAVSSFCWHASRPQLLCLSANNGLRILNIRRPITVSFSNLSRLCFGFGSQLFEGPVLSNSDPLAADSAASDSDTSKPAPETGDQSSVADADKDISLVMHQRAKRGYGGDAKANRELARTFNSPDILFAWRWLCNAKYSVKKNTADFRGVYSIISRSKGSHVSSSPLTPVKPAEDAEDADSHPSKTTPSSHSIAGETTPQVASTTADADSPAIAYLRSIHTVYTSSERSLSLRLCGWGFVSYQKFWSNIEMLVEGGLVTKAVAIALFHLEVQAAIFVLRMKNHSQDPVLKLIDMALAGINENPSAQWRSSLQFLKDQMIDPYAIAIVSFLCKTERDGYQDILVDCKISFLDKIAFACRYLDDESLKTYLEATRTQMIKLGLLIGVALTGIDSTGGGVDLLQEYLNRTCNIQTVALLLCHTSPRKNAPDRRPLLWIGIYRQLLNTWKMWMERAQLEALRGSFLGTPLLPQVVVRCNICSAPLNASKGNLSHFKITAPIKLGLLNEPKALATTSALGNAKTAPGMPEPSIQDKITTACPSCHKRLPRCALCLLPLTCVVPTPNSLQRHDAPVSHSGAQSFDNWFSWCQTCKHGGHVKHLLSWFEESNVCPVADCDCRCSFR
ncbi:GATOR complex protein MIOS-like [Schistocerca gregaria]|uniref:GATOR complex protein MIOS-like n=1 Tax=Schistocerca gregaria TaxID=7010 RepID=UPI00211DA9E8|nr:GATOR complex protein MIOS-like [Schistocerca gregaria]